MLFVRDLWYVCACVYESSEASAYSFGLATNPTRARSYPLNINPEPETISGPAGSGRVADLYTTHRRVEEFGYSCRQRRLTWARRRRTGLLPSGPKSSFQMRASFVFHLETKVLESGGRVEKLIAQVAWSPVLSFHSLWWFGVQCHLLVLVHCVFWKPTSLHPFTNTFWSTSCFLLLTSFLKTLISFSSRTWHLPTLPKAPKAG